MKPSSKTTSRPRSTHPSPALQGRIASATLPGMLASLAFLLPFRRGWRHSGRIAVVLALQAVGAGVSLAQVASGKDWYSIPELTSLLRDGVTAARVTTLIATSRCIEWRGSDAELATLQQAGATSAVVNSVRRSPRCTPETGAQSGASPSPVGDPSGPASGLGIGFGPEQFATIVEGSFIMGSATGAQSESPTHRVTISRAFQIQRTEVTQAQWRAVMGTTPSAFSACGPNCPVEQVSWDDIQVFLSVLNGRDPGKGYRLPTEAEWEFAARAGTSGEYGGTGDVNAMGWYDVNSGRATHPVARQFPNAWGLYDMHGNVWEWVQDYYDAEFYGVSSASDPFNMRRSKFRVLRGGSWDYSAFYARSSSRGNNSSNIRNNLTGFWLVRNP